MTTVSTSLRPSSAPRGFTLVEIVVVLFILAVVIGMAATITRAVIGTQKRVVTTTRMATVDSALVQFVMQQKRLPCPADGTLASGATNAGVEANRDPVAGCTSEQNGVVPWQTLGLSETDTMDGWDRRMTYRIQPLLAADNALDMTGCDPSATIVALTAAGTCQSGCPSIDPAQCTSPYNFVYGKGLEVRNVAGSKVMDPSPGVVGTPPTGAGYVMISPGETGGGGYLNSGTLGASTVVDGTEEFKNYASLPLAAYYVDDSENDTSGAATHFDDVVSRPSLLTVINKAGLGPRSH